MTTRKSLYRNQFVFGFSCPESCVSCYLAEGSESMSLNRVSLPYLYHYIIDEPGRFPFSIPYTPWHAACARPTNFLPLITSF